MAMCPRDPALAKAICGQLEQQRKNLQSARDALQSLVDNYEDFGIYRSMFCNVNWIHGFKSIWAWFSIENLDAVKLRNWSEHHISWLQEKRAKKITEDGEAALEAYRAVLDSMKM